MPSVQPSHPGSADLNRWTRWCFETCLLYGCDPATAGRVAAYFCDAIREHV